jgi:hypothetical protein
VALTSVTDNSTVGSPATGLLVYNTNTSGSAPNNVIPGYYYWNGNNWALISGSVGNVTGIAKFYNSGSQSYSSGMNVAFNSTELNSISSFVSLSNNGIILQPGIYELQGNVGGLIATGTTGDGRAYSGFYNNTTSSFVGQGGQSASGNSGNHNGLGNNAATAIVQVTSATTFYLKIDNAINLGSISQQSDFSTASLGRAWVTIRKYQ